MPPCRVEAGQQHDGLGNTPPLLEENPTHTYAIEVFFTNVGFLVSEITRGKGLQNGQTCLPMLSMLYLAFSAIVCAESSMVEAEEEEQEEQAIVLS